VANSFSQWVNAWGEADFVITHPEDYELDPKFTKGATITQNQDEALKGCRLRLYKELEHLRGLWENILQ
jgi:hypothetical protein